jgi:beta-glucosidase
MKSNFLIYLLLLSVSASAQHVSIYHPGWIDFNKNGKKDVYENPTMSVNERVVNLLSQMTVNEKTCQLATLYGYGRVLKDEQPTPAWKQSIWKDGIANIDEMLNGLAYHPKAVTEYSYPFSKHANAINTIQRWFIEETRLGIPVDFTNEGIHGLCHDRATPLPAPISMGSTWNKDLIFKAGSMIGQEAKALGYTNIYAPILDPARDPRWGRVVECYGENPFHIAELGIQLTRGIQSKGVASTLKHYAVYSVPKGGRDGDARTDPHVAPRELHQIYLYPFMRVVKEAAPMGIMSSYNDWDGEPVSGSQYFLTELLRQRFGFKGYIVSDSEALEFIFSKHHVVADYKGAIKQALQAGLNVRTNFTAPEEFLLPLRELIREKKISMSTIDTRVAEVLRVKFRLGLFDSPLVKDIEAANSIVHSEAHKELALKMNRQSMVLLKNTDGLLPLSTERYKKILVTGPLAVEQNYTTSRYGPSNNTVTPVLKGIQDYVGSNATVSYEKGCDVTDTNWPESEIIETPLTPTEEEGIQKAVKQAEQSDIVIAVVGETEKCVGESLSRTSLNLPGRQLKLLQALFATGKPVVMVMINGRPLTINWENKFLPAIMEAWFPGPESGKVIAETLFGDNNPGGKLAVTYPKSVGQIEYNFPYKPGSQAGQPGKGPNGSGRSSVEGALYPFGFGLSYTTFAYSNLRIGAETIGQNESLDVFVDVQNTGKVQGDEIVQMYVKDMVSNRTAYEYDLRGFDRVSLKPGERRMVQFKLNPASLALPDANGNWKVEPGSFQVMVGASSVDLLLKKQFEVK